MDNYKKANVEGKIVGYLPNGLIEVDYAGTPLVVMESENEYAENQPCKLTLAQKREYELLKLHGSVYVYGLKRRGVFEQLKEKGLCHTDGSHHWFHLSKGQSVKECENEYLESSDKAAMSNDDYIVKDKNGQPLIVYHGTPDSRFSEIKNSLMGQESDKLTGGGKGVVWFSDNYRTAKSYADDTRAFDYQNAIPKVFSRYVILKKPLTVDAAGQLWRKVELEINGQKIVGTRNLVDYARKNGYDGLIVKNVYDHYNHFAGQAKDKRNLATNYAVFNDEQIKSIQEHAQGGSMEMYHAGRVEAIGDNHLINELGIHLGSKETADKIGELKGVETKKYKVDIKNPIELPDFPRWEAFVVSRKLKDMGILTENEFEEIRKETGNEKEKLLLQLLKKKGYDGFVYENAFEGGGKSYVAFDKKQVTEYAQGGSLIPEKYRRLGFTAVGKKEKSYLPKKKWMVLAKKGDHYKVVHGGYTGMEDFSEHKDPERRKRFWQRMGGYSKDPFSALYWHKKFGTWEDGGSLADIMSKEMREQIDRMKNWKQFLNENANISSTITQMILDYKVIYKCSISDINNGMCVEFSEEIIEKLGGENENLYILHSDEFYDEFREGNFDNPILTDRGDWNKDTLEKYGYLPIDLSSLNNGLVHHQWIYYNGKHYDAERPNGVNKWFELPIFQRMIKRVKNNLKSA